MEIVELSLKGLKLIKPRILKDKRGYFTESYNKSRYIEKGIDSIFVQDNHSFSYKNTIRGMHFQKKPGQAKLVSAFYGKIWDVAVDIRKNSPTFGKWEGVILDDENAYQLFIPVGFAHGFCILSNSAHVIYKMSNYYDEKKEMGFFYADPMINIRWPIENPILSQRDRGAPLLKEIFL